MAARPQRKRLATAQSAICLGGLVLMLGLGSGSMLSAPALACGNAAVDAAEQYRSPVDLSALSSAQQAALEATVAKRRAALPYRFLSLQRCPSLSNRALHAFENQDYRLCLELLDRAIAEHPGSLTRWLDRAVVHYYLGEETAARADVEAVRSRLTSYADSHRIQDAYRQLAVQLDGNPPDPRRAVKVPQ